MSNSGQPFQTLKDLPFGKVPVGLRVGQPRDRLGNPNRCPLRTTTRRRGGERTSPEYLVILCLEYLLFHAHGVSVDCLDGSHRARQEAQSKPCIIWSDLTVRESQRYLTLPWCKITLLWSTPRCTYSGASTVAIQGILSEYQKTPTATSKAAMTGSKIIRCGRQIHHYNTLSPPIFPGGKPS